ncbi:MAG: precorrin-2/cobalt-factor-2 C20-methyltransferase [Frankiales bacterium]|jgi:precorrin-2/cobalt-factor-2 C20-methyltransferase|nr:precorrin-2/cobalt-factor-2 C20-methyltransferase [Frankiales bacterium]MDX6222439.1 precorrin-2/cobalt-factor-2 C20-methyltransferase [Frankiales bacterium]
MRLVGVGVGPGDPELVTVKAVRELREAAVVFVPVTDTGEIGRAEATVLAYVDEARVRRLRFAIHDDDARRHAWDQAGAEVAAALEQGDAAFATIGDPNIYSTFTYLAATVCDLLPGVEISTVPGITAMQDLAARSGTVLVEGTETLALLPFTAGAAALAHALDTFDTVVAYKGGRRFEAVIDVVRRAGRIDEAVYGARLGLDGEEVLGAAEHTGPAHYLSTLLVPAKRTGRGGRL